MRIARLGGLLVALAAGVWWRPVVPLWLRYGTLSPGAALLRAAKEGDSGAVEDLISRGVSPNVQDGDAATPLMVAAGRGFTRTVQTLLTRGADVGATQRGNPVLVDAVMGRYSDVIWKSRDEARGLAPEDGHFGTIRALLEHGADANSRYLDAGRGEDWPVLHTAAVSVDVERAGLLIRHGADVKAKDGKGKTALQVAREARNGFFRVPPAARAATVRLLKEAGARE